MFTIGNYTGGNLFYYDADKKTYRILRTKNRAILFDGNFPHGTTPYKGERFSFVFFATDKCIGLKKELACTLENAGFNYPWNLKKNTSVTPAMKKKFLQEACALIRTDRVKLHNQGHLSAISKHLK